MWRKSPNLNEIPNSISIACLHADFRNGHWVATDVHVTLDALPQFDPLGAFSSVQSSSTVSVPGRTEPSTGGRVGFTGACLSHVTTHEKPPPANFQGRPVTARRWVRIETRHFMFLVCDSYDFCYPKSHKNHKYAGKLKNRLWNEFKLDSQFVPRSGQYMRTMGSIIRDQLAKFNDKCSELLICTLFGKAFFDDDHKLVDVYCPAGPYSSTSILEQELDAMNELRDFVPPNMRVIFVFGGDGFYWINEPHRANEARQFNEICEVVRQHAHALGFMTCSGAAEVAPLQKHDDFHISGTPRKQ